MHWIENILTESYIYIYCIYTEYIFYEIAPSIQNGLVIKVVKSFSFSQYTVYTSATHLI